MKTSITTAVLLGMTGFACAEETIAEKTGVTAHDATRSIKKGVNRAQETVCGEGDVKCLSEKAKHRAEEGTDYSKDKLKELKSSVDRDNK
jgi:hypothetical protein